MADLFTLTEENESLASKDELDFIFSQAEKLLKESLSSGDSVLTRSTILLSILIALLTSEIGYVSNLLMSTPVISKLMAVVFISLLLTSFNIYKLQFNLRGKDYKAIGSQPKDLFHNWYFDNKKNDHARYKAILISEIKSYQDRIVQNNELNKRRWNCFHLTLVLTMAIPILFIVCYVILSIF